MAGSSPSTLEHNLSEAGNRLLRPLSDYELLPLLDQLEIFLSRVEQSPSASMRSALSPSVKALVVRELLGHSNEDVKVAIACCISEITRITAPNAPYDDDIMKEFFQIIVSSFSMLCNEPSITYTKRASILETFAKLRLCVVMLDLECDSLIVEMFRNFFTAIRDFHPDIIFASMAAIMCLVLEESEYISVDLLTPLLDSVKLDKQTCAPVARSLGTIVLKKCAAKIKPYLEQALESLGTSLEDYHEVVSFIFLNDHTSIVQADATVSVDDQQLVEVSKEASDIDTADDSSPEKLKHNGVKPVTSDESSPRKSKSSKENFHQRKDFNNQKALDSQPSNKRVRKSKGVEKLKSSVKSSHAVEITERRAKKLKSTHSSPSEDALAVASTPLSKEADMNTAISHPLKNSETEDVNVTSPSPRNLFEDSHPIKGKTQMKKERSSRRLNTPVSMPKMASDEGTCLPESGSDGIPKVGISNEDTVVATTPVLTDKSIIESKLRESKGKGNASLDHDRKSGGETLQRNRGKRVSKKDSPLPKSGLKTIVIELPDDDIPKMNSQGKSASKKDSTPNVKRYGRSIVHSRIQVWWPDDKSYYKGVVHSYNRSTRRHMVLYDDGDTEILDLQKEDWKILDDDEKDSEGNLPAKSSEMKKGKGEKKEKSENNSDGGSVEDAPVISEDVEDSGEEVSRMRGSGKSKGEKEWSEEEVNPGGGKEAIGESTPEVRSRAPSQRSGGKTAYGKEKGERGRSGDSEAEEKDVSEGGKGKSSSRKKQKVALSS